jgi:hypothetical protein
VDSDGEAEVGGCGPEVLIIPGQAQGIIKASVADVPPVGPGQRIPAVADAVERPRRHRRFSDGHPARKARAAPTTAAGSVVRSEAGEWSSSSGFIPAGERTADQGQRRVAAQVVPGQQVAAPFRSSAPSLVGEIGLLGSSGPLGARVRRDSAAGRPARDGPAGRNAGLPAPGWKWAPRALTTT